ncbi:hypothetical protein SHELI_v1c02140 [Spiroplasma helicoides]|uniref:Uncharacterized protein n=1 Tax=Spiroplasma helicoides TaxID=216938 RepID=A0A1B3SJR0_9MOLU|nr:hypothetical protein [Spiroplasma helicoides]AOG60169.1 hypothetical protein SHELI_v1c02140 [Spiroplasma helicoides]
MTFNSKSEIKFIKDQIEFNLQYKFKKTKNLADIPDRYLNGNKTNGEKEIKKLPSELVLKYFPDVNENDDYYDDLKPAGSKNSGYIFVVTKESSKKLVGKKFTLFWAPK